MSFKSYLIPVRVLVDLHPLIVISCEGLSISLLVGSSEFGGAGGKRILSPNKCFFFLTSFPDMNLEEKGNKDNDKCDPCNNEDWCQL